LTTYVTLPILKYVYCCHYGADVGMGIWGSSDYFHFTITFGTLITKDAEYSTLTGVELMYGSNNPTLVPCLVTNNVSNFFNGRENNL
jgi:hypothetical protein